MTPPKVWVGLSPELWERILEHIGVNWLCLPEQAAPDAIRAALEREGEAFVAWANDGYSVMNRNRFYPARRVLVVPLEEGDK